MHHHHNISAVSVVVVHRVEVSLRSSLKLELPIPDPYAGHSVAQLLGVAVVLLLLAWAVRPRFEHHRRQA